MCSWDLSKVLNVLGHNKTVEIWKRTQTSNGRDALERWEEKLHGIIRLKLTTDYDKNF